MEEFGKLEERVVLIGVQTGDNDNVEESLNELEELASTAGAVTVGKIIQNREAVHPGTYIGKGKIEEVRALVYAMNATGVICDDELSPAQLNNLERELDCKVMDRTLLILDIFAARAITSEGKIQVELAQLRYRSARLILEALGKEAVIHGEMCLGEGSGAVALFPFLDMGIAVYDSMSTFEDIHVEQYEELV